MPATPDTSPANVARVLRECAHRMSITGSTEDAYRAVFALADALDQQAAEPERLSYPCGCGCTVDAYWLAIPHAGRRLCTACINRERDQQAAAPTWEERVERAVTGWNIRCAQPEFASLPDALAAALKAAFPELAPTDA